MNYQGVAEVLSSKADFGFKWHLEDPVECAAIETAIPRFDQLQIDDFGHLGVEGSELVADWVEQEFLKPKELI